MSNDFKSFIELMTEILRVESAKDSMIIHLLSGNATEQEEFFSYNGR